MALAVCQQAKDYLASGDHQARARRSRLSWVGLSLFHPRTLPLFVTFFPIGDVASLSISAWLVVACVPRLGLDRPSDG